MKILMCNYEYPPLGGGGGVVMAALARELARRHVVTVLTSKALGLQAESIEAGVRVVRAPVFFRRQLAVANFPSMLAFLPMAAQRGLGLARGGTFDVINTHFVVPTGPVGYLLGALYRVPNVLSVHGGDLFDPSKRSSPHRHAWLRTPIRQLLLRADRLVGQSRDTLKRVEEIYGVQRATELIPLGIERPPAVADALREEFNLPIDAFVMVSVGRLVTRKSTVQLVRALSASQRALVHLLLVGDGPDVEMVRTAAAEAGVGDRVHLLGYVTDEQKYRALAVSDIFVSSSQHEGFGLVFLEAMAFGLPIVCYDRGGQTDFLSTGETGNVICLNDLEAFTAAIVALHDQPGIRRAISERNRLRVEHYFIDKCAERYEEVFESAIRQASERRSRPR
jgi:glycosyltransferase involved in cell wall biosynthesis